jgi:hypothetical protein
VEGSRRGPIIGGADCSMVSAGTNYRRGRLLNGFGGDQLSAGPIAQWFRRGPIIGGADCPMVSAGTNYRRGRLLNGFGGDQLSKGPIAQWFHRKKIGPRR